MGVFKYFLLYFVFFIFFGFSFLFSKVSAAYDPPLFSCDQPVGTLISNHADGTHGVPGDQSSYSGSDAVYKIDENYILQCLCPPSGEGIASNWWKVDGLSSGEIDFFRRRGWFFVSNGQDWGLSPDPYLINNSKYSCNLGTGGGAVLGSSSTQSRGQGKILGVSSLADTGTTAKFWAYLSIGTFFAWLTYRLNKS